MDVLNISDDDEMFEFDFVDKMVDDQRCQKWRQERGRHGSGSVVLTNMHPQYFGHKRAP